MVGYVNRVTYIFCLALYSNYRGGCPSFSLWIAVLLAFLSSCIIFGRRSSDLI